MKIKISIKKIIKVVIIKAIKIVTRSEKEYFF